MKAEAIPPADPGEWFVAFHSGETRQWWEWLDRPGYGHCCAFAFSSHGAVWLLYDVTRHRTFVRAYQPDAFMAWLDDLCDPKHAATILSVPTPPLEPLHHFRLGFWCTVAVKHLLGLRSRALRPKALCRDLLAMGAQYAFGTGPKT